MKRSFFKMAAPCAVLLLPVIAVVTVTATAVAQVRTDPMIADTVQRGAKVYAANCSFCHGPTAKGAVGPSLIDSALVRHDRGGDQIAPLLHQGRTEKGMPAFPTLTADQVTDLVAFLHARIVFTDSRETEGPRSGYQKQQLLTGNAQAGEAYFNGKGQCSQCHSAKGDLAGIAAKYQPTELEGRILYPRGKTSTVTVTLRDGRQYTGKLLHADPFYVSLEDSDGKYHSWTASSVKAVVNDPLEKHRQLLATYTNKDVHDLLAYLETLK
ncbi:MAG: c-type cytochrome [Terriglobus sp.]